MDKLREGQIRVWWIRQVPNIPLYFPVDTIDDAIKRLKMLEHSDLANPLIETNAGGLEIVEDGEWTEFYNDEGEDINSIMEDNNG